MIARLTKSLLRRLKYSTVLLLLPVTPGCCNNDKQSMAAPTVSGLQKMMIVTGTDNCPHCPQPLPGQPVSQAPESIKIY
jgi:hypothetical protein